VVRSLGRDGQQLIQVLPGVMVAGNEQGDAMARHLREQAGGEDAGAFFTLRGGAPPAERDWPGSAPAWGVVVVDQVALSRQGD